MKSKLRRHAASAATLTSLVSGVLAGSAQAAPVLPNAVSYEYLGIIFAENERSSTSIGTLVYTGAGCGGVCSATTALGSDPSASAMVDEVSYDNSGGGTATSNLGYYVEYVNAPGTYNIDLHSSVNLFSGSSSVSAYLQFGQAGANYANFNNFNSIELAQQSSLDGCNSCALASDIPPVQADTIVQVVANTPYFVQEGVNLDLEADGVPNGASIDPTFSDQGAHGTFLFSPGVFQGAAAPEPSTWAMMLIGLGVTGAAIRRSRSGRAGRRVVA